MKSFFCAAITAALLLSGCAPEPEQWLVSVATDAPVPHFGDHLVLEVVGADASCSGCLRIIGVDGPESLPVTFGVVPRKEGDTVRVRARLYRAEQAAADGLPDTPALIDAVAKLPPLDGKTEVAFNLSMNCFGVESLVKEGKTCDSATGTLAPEPVLPPLDGTAQPKAGSWPGAATAACAGQAPEGMVCIPGGAFILGTPRPGYEIDLDAVSLPEHLVKVSRFALDADEMTVGTVRNLVKGGMIQSKPVLGDKSAPTSLVGACTYLGADDDTNDALPVNCVSHDLAEEACAALNKRLPSEAEWEYAAGNLADETPYPWGAGSDLCLMTVLGMGRDLAANEADMDVFENPGCRAENPMATWGPAPGGNSNDVTTLGVHDLAGNMSEWTADTFAPYSAPCWQPTGTLLVDPVCQEPVPGAQQSFTARGSAWAGYKFEALATARRNPGKTTGDPYTGFRCAKSM